jgi:hypothetical protein
MANVESVMIRIQTPFQRGDRARWVLLAAAGWSLVLAVGGCASSSDRSSSGLPAAQSLTPSTSRESKNGLSTQVMLEVTQVRAGTPIKGTIVVTNTTGRSIAAPAGCAISYEVVLTSPRYKPIVAWPADCEYNRRSASSFAPGVTKMAVTVSTTYLACGGQGPSDPTMPPCAGAGLPPLPAGVYYTELVSNGTEILPIPPAVRVTLLGPN